MAVDKAIDSAKLDSALTATADAIREKSGESGAIVWDGESGFAEAIGGIETGGGFVPLEEKDVNFYDYDGTLLYSYTLDELQALTELPPNASHDGLVGQGWNWSLEGLKENNGPLDVAALYITEDEATWFDLENDLGRDVEVTFLWRQYSANGARIDFGDGSDVHTDPAASGDLSVKHTYRPGKYRAKISGEYNLRGTATSCCVNDIAAGGSSILRRVYFGFGGYLYGHSFLNCIHLETITLCDGLGFSGVQIFNNCARLKFCYTSNCGDAIGVSSGAFGNGHRARIVSFGESITLTYSVPSDIERGVFARKLSLNSANFVNNYVINRIVITEATTLLAQRFIQSCFSLRELTIPAQVETINAYAFNGTSNLRRLRFERETPPSIANANAFTNFPTDCIVEVPAASLAAYQTATNYATIAAQMVGV